MILNNKNDEEQVIIATCDCGCGAELEVKKYIDKDSTTPPNYSINLKSSLFDQEQVGIFKLMKNRLKRAWYDLRGKSYLYLDICLTEAQYIDLCKSLNSLKSSKKNSTK